MYVMFLLTYLNYGQGRALPGLLRVVVFLSRVLQIRKLIDATADFSVEEWPYRTTLALDDRGWNMIEFCEDLRKLDSKGDIVEVGETSDDLGVGGNSSRADRFLGE